MGSRVLIQAASLIYNFLPPSQLHDVNSLSSGISLAHNMETHDQKLEKKAVQSNFCDSDNIFVFHFQVLSDVGLEAVRTWQTMWS